MLRATSLRVAVVVAVCVLMGACTGQGEAGGPASEATPGPEEVRAAREALGRPMVALADSLLAAGAAVDAARHQAPRGSGAREAAAALATPLQALRDAALAADAAARPLGGEDRVGRAAAVLTDAAAVALRAADEGAAQAAALQRLSDLDAQMDTLVAEWAAPGSQAERRTALLGDAEQARALQSAAQAEPAVPEPCPALRDARVRWAGLLAEHSTELAGLAGAGSGAAFDERRAQLSTDPYGGDRLAADAADRSCWGQNSVLANAAAGIRDQVEILEQLLQA